MGYRFLIGDLRAGVMGSQKLLLPDPESGAPFSFGDRQVEP